MKKNKISTMKKWGIASLSISLSLTLAVLIGTFCSDKDMSTLATVTGFAYAELATFTAAYSYKEKSANKQKVAVSLIKELADKYGIESISGIIQSVIQD